MLKRRKKGYRYGMIDIEDVEELNPELETYRRKKWYEE